MLLHNDASLHGHFAANVNDNIDIIINKNKNKHCSDIKLTR